MVKLTYLKQTLTETNPREKTILVIGAIALIIGIYFFVIEPMHHKTMQLQQTVQQRQAQLSEMQSMARKLLGRKKAESATILLAGKLASETQIEGKRVQKTQPMSAEKSKKLMQQLATQGKVTLYGAKDNLVEVWFWQK